MLRQLLYTLCRVQVPSRHFARAHTQHAHQSRLSVSRSHVSVSRTRPSRHAADTQRPPPAWPYIVRSGCLIENGRVRKYAHLVGQPYALWYVDVHFTPATKPSSVQGISYTVPSVETLLVSRATERARAMYWCHLPLRPEPKAGSCAPRRSPPRGRSPIAAGAGGVAPSLEAGSHIFAVPSCEAVRTAADLG